MDKSHVSMTQYICPVCGDTHERNSEILIDKRLQNSMEKYTLVGYRLCEKDYKENYVCCIGVTGNGPEDKFLGTHAYIAKHAIKEMLDVDVTKHEFIFVDASFIDRCREIMEKQNNAGNDL